MKDCSWLIKRNTNGRCKLDVFHDGEYKPIRGLCPKTCGVCGDGGSNENIQEELVELQESNRKQDEKIKQLEELVTYHEEAIKKLQGPPTMAPAEHTSSPSSAPTTFGYGCYSTGSCTCDDKTCNAEGCAGEGYYWISPQTSARGCGLETRCTDEQLANCKATGAPTVSPTMAPTTFGYGCYSTGSCTCDDKTCNAEGCTGEGFLWISPQTSSRGCGLDTRCTEEQLANCKATGAPTVPPTNSAAPTISNHPTQAPTP